MMLHRNYFLVRIIPKFCLLQQHEIVVINISDILLVTCNLKELGSTANISFMM